MGGGRRTDDAARARVSAALAAGRRGGARARPDEAPHALLGLQRRAGNAAVSALLAAKWRSPGDQARKDIDAGLREIRRDEPTIDLVEKGLRAAKATGVPVDLEGTKPPPSALAVTKTGFGPEAVPAKKPVPPANATPKVSPLGKAAAKAGKKGKGGKRAAGAGAGAGGGPAAGSESAGAAGPDVAAGALSADQLLQPPVAPAGVRPEDDPAFTAVTSKVTGFAKKKRAHPPAASKAQEGQGAAVAPTDDLTGQAKAAKADTMNAQQPGTFDKKAFIAAVKAAIEAKSPKTLKEADNFKKSGKAGEVKGEVKGLVAGGKQGQSKDIETATAAAPDTSKGVPKPVTPLAQESPGKAAKVVATGAVPKPAPPEQTNLEAGKHAVGSEMAEADVDEKQLAESNEPEFEQALADKKAAAKHADTAPGEFRQQEQQTIGQVKGEATDVTSEGVAGIQGARGAAIAKLVADKGKTKSKDEAKRAEVTGKIQALFDATEADVNKILDGIDPKVDAVFEKGEAFARAKFESYVAAKMSAYKKDRYGGWLGGLRWAKDKLLGMPSKVNEFYEAGRELYLKEMDKVISRVADIVGGDLSAAKKRIAKGRADIAAYVKSLPTDLKKLGAQASSEIGDSFSQLEKDVDAKQDAVVDTLATKYVESRKGLDERIEALQAENRGLVDKAIGAIKAVINTIRKLAAMLRDVLARAAGVVGKIVKAPAKFLDNLIAGVKGGILKFKDNFVDHLRNGLMGWLFGALAEGGVELPDTFDIKGVVKLLASIFGLTWRNIRNRLVKQIGEKAMGAVEKGVDIFQRLATEGVGGLWQMLVEKLGDIKEMILDQVKDFVLTKIITAGITWLIGLLNPVAAFIKACKLIYDVVMFFVNNAERIAKFVNTILDSVSDIVRGNVGGVVSKINDVLGQMVPIIIGFLASVIGLGGIGQKVRAIVTALRKPVTKALDFVIKTGLKLAGPVIRGLKGIGGRVKAKVAAGKAWVKGKAEAGKKWAREKLSAGAAGLGRLRDRLLGVTFRRHFEAKGERHSVYTKRGNPGVLFTASNETPSAQAAPTPDVTALDRRFRTAMDEYVALASRADRDRAAAQRAASLHVQAEQILTQIVTATKAYVLSRGSSEGDPGESAVGLGQVGRHGEKPSSQRGGHRLHHLESEHIIPFAAGKSLWRALKLYLPWRGSHEDNAQTTIMIYERAARIKTPADNARSYAFKTAIDASTLPRAIARGRTVGVSGLDTSAAEDALAKVEAYLEDIRQDAVSRTVDAVETENRMVEPGSTRSNGQRRGDEPPTPGRPAIDGASARQFSDVLNLVREEVLNRQSLSEKVERIIRRPRRR